MRRGIGRCGGIFECGGADQQFVAEPYQFVAESYQHGAIKLIDLQYEHC